MAEIVVGTSGYYYRDWVGRFYPDGTKQREMLRIYAQRFGAVELNFTYYGLPKAASMARMSALVPEDFKFVVKTHKTATHERTLAEADAFKEGIEPIRESGQLAGLLAQFPFSFHNTGPNREHLARLAGVFAGYPLFVEFRHASWARDVVYDFLKKNGLGFVAVDEPELPNLMPPAAPVTSGAGYVRFHSRDARKWYGGARYDYDYSQAELSEWVPRVKGMAEAGAETIFVFFNNCHAAQAAENAEAMRGLLGAG